MWGVKCTCGGSLLGMHVGLLLRNAHLRFPHPAIRLHDVRGLSYQASAVTSWQHMVQDLGNGAAGLHMDLCAGSIGTLKADLHWGTRHGIETLNPEPLNSQSVIWVAVKELKLSYYIRETLLFTIYTHYGNLI